MKNIGFTVFQNIWETESSSVMSFDELMIILSSEQMKSRIEDLRGITNDDERKKRKCYLPNITVNGIFPHRCDNGLTYYNQITALDFDHIPDNDMEIVKKELMTNPLTCLMFVSPSGNGYKVFVRHDNMDPGLHWNMYAQLIKEFDSIPYIDKQVHDLSRATFLSYDNNFYYHPQSEVYHHVFSPPLIVAPQSKSKCTASKDITTNTSPMTQNMVMMNTIYQANWKDKALMDYIDKYQWKYYPGDYQQGHRNESIIKKATQLCLCGVHYDTALWKLNYLYTRDPANAVPLNEIEKRTRYAYINNAQYFGSERKKWIDIKNTRMKRQ